MCEQISTALNANTTASLSRESHTSKYDQSMIMTRNSLHLHTFLCPRLVRACCCPHTFPAYSLCKQISTALNANTAASLSRESHTSKDEQSMIMTRNSSHLHTFLCQCLVWACCCPHTFPAYSVCKQISTALNANTASSLSRTFHTSTHDQSMKVTRNSSHLRTCPCLVWAYCCPGTGHAQGAGLWTGCVQPRARSPPLSPTQA